MERRSVLIGAAGLASLALVAACGGSPNSGSGSTGAEDATKVYAEINPLTGTARRDKLVELAKAEGNTLSIYTSLNADIADIVTPEFTKATGVKVKVYRADSETVLQRVLQESSAKYAGSDVVESNANEMAVLADKGLTGDYESEYRAKVNKDFQYDGWTPTRFNVFAPAWNTKLISGSMIPKSWEDLADPKYDGKVSVEVGDYDWYMTLYKYLQKQGKSDAEVDKYFTDLVKGAKVVKGHSQQVELLGAGEFGVIAASYSYLTAKGAKTGAPITDQPYLEPVIARANGGGVMKSAQHPAAAMLFMDWFLSDGQKIIQDNGLTPSVKPDGTDPLAGLSVVPVDLKLLLSEGRDWAKRYDTLLQGGTKTGDAS